MVLLDELPDSLLLEIFSNVGYESLCLGVRMVCSRWHKISQDADLWRYIDIPEHYTDARFILFLEQIQQHVEGIECSKCENLTSEAYQIMGKMTFPRLKHLAVPVVNGYTDEMYEMLVNVCPLLEELENITANVDNTCHPLCVQMSFKTLKVVHDKPLSAYGRIRKAAPGLGQQKRDLWLNDLTAVAAACPDVDTYRCRRGLDYVNDESFEKISQMFPKLMFLELNYCSITDQGLDIFFKHQKGVLREIVLDKAGELTDKGLKVLADNCPRLSILKVSRIVCVSNIGVAYLVEKCRHLQELHLNNTVYKFDESANKKVHFNNTVLHHIGAACRDLIYFRMFYSDHITTSGMIGLSEGCRILQGVMLYECPQIDDSSLKSLLDLPFLKAIVLSNCKGITPKGLLDFVLLAPCLYRLTFYTNEDYFYGDMTQLAEDTYERLDVNFRPNVLKKLTLKGVGGAFVQLLTVLCPSLHSLDLRESTTVGTLCLETVLRNCSELRTLDVQFVPALEDAFLHAISKHGMALRRLGLGSAVMTLSTEALVEIIKECPSLISIAMDTQGSIINEEVLVNAAKEYHGGNCFLHLDPECREPQQDFPHRFIELHFTPIKFLGSVPTSYKIITM